MEGGANKSPIIILSSDDDDDEDVQDLFKEFVSKVERYVAQKDVVLFLKLKFAEARSEFVSSAKFKSALKWRTKQLDNSNVYIYTGDICKLLAADSKQEDCKSKTECEKSQKESKAVLDRGWSSAGNNDVAMHSTRVEAGVNKSIIHLTIEEDNSDNGVEKLPAKPTCPQPSTSTAHFAANSPVEFKKEDKRKSHEASASDPKPSTPAKPPLSPQKRKRKRLVKRLEEKLKHVGDRIKILNQAELSLDEMAMNDSTYIQECRLKERFNKIWDKICKVQGRNTDTGRVIEKVVKCPPTGFPDIDRAVNRFLRRKKGRFPDRFDINNVILEAKKKHSLKISPQALGEISDDIFISIGNKLQKRRKRDFQFNFGCHLTDDYRASNDPALNDPTLRKKLEENKRVNKRALDEVFNKFTHYGRMKNEGSSGSSSSDSEKTKPENKVSRISVTEPSDSSDNECDDFGLEEEGTDDNYPVINNDGSPPGRNLKDDKAHPVLKSSDTNDNDLDDFVIKKPHCITETDSRTGHDTENSNSLQSKEIELSRNCAIVELPSSVLCDCIDITAEQTEVADIHDECSNNDAKNSQQDFENNTAIELNAHKKQALMSAVLEDLKTTSQDIPYLPKNDAVSEKLDSNLDTEDLIITSQSVNISASNKNPVSVEIDVNIPDTLTSTVAGSSGASNDVGSEVSTETSVNKKRKCQDSQGKGSPSHNKTVANKLSTTPKLAVPLPPPAQKVQKSSLLSLSAKKRKADNKSLEYESPLKIFRSATLEIVGKKDIVSSVKTDDSEGKTRCKESTLSSQSESDELSITCTNNVTTQTTVNGHSPLQKHGPRKLPLSLNKSGRSSPIIVLSDDDSDS